MSSFRITRLKSFFRLFAIYSELGYNPWRKPRKEREARKKIVRKDREGSVYMGAREAIIPFLNNDTKRTFSHLLLRPGFMMRDYILRGHHEQYLAPLTAMLVFFSIFTLLLSVINPRLAKDSLSDRLIEALQSETLTVEADSTFSNPKSARVLDAVSSITYETLVLTRLDMHPEAADKPWKESLAAVERDIRSKGIPLFLGGFILLWLSMAIVLKKYGINSSGAAAASAYVMCQSCLFMLFSLVITLGRSTDLGLVLTALLLFIDYQQLLGIGNKKAIRLTIKTGLFAILLEILFYLILASILILLVCLRLLR